MHSSTCPDEGCTSLRMLHNNPHTARLSVLLEAHDGEQKNESGISPKIELQYLTADLAIFHKV